VAKALFFEQGFVGASMADIAARVGGSKATLYNHFRSKEELLIAVVEDVLASIETEVSTAPPPDDFRAWLGWLGRASVDRFTSHDIVSLQRLSAAEAFRFPEVGRIVYEQGVVPSIDMVATFFEKAMDARVIRRSDPREAAQFFLELCTGWMLRRVLWNIAPPPSPAEVDHLVDASVTVFFEGYGRH